MKYETAIPIGQGGIAEVLRAFDPELKRDVALKLLRHDDPLLAQRMVFEAQAQARVEHPHVCPVYETGTTDDGQIYIAMQYIDGDTLDVAAGGMSLEEKVRLLREVTWAVQAAHAVGLIHRDLKPGNILVERLGDGSLKPWVVDFGLARQHDAPGLTVTGQVMGTPAYMSPEQARGEPTVDRRTDVYALGAVLYHLLAGRPPFVGESTVEVLVQILQEEPVPVRKITPRTPADLETIAMTCLEKEPGRRYASARALADDLTRYLEGDPIAAHPASLAYRLATKARKNKWVAALVTLLALALPASAVKYTLDLGAERRRALAAQREAENLMDFMLEDLYERLVPLGRVDLLGEVARESLGHYERRGGDDLDLETRRRRARAHRNVGLVLAAQGDTEEALAHFRRFRSLVSELCALESDNLGWRYDLSESHRLIGETLQEQGDIEGSLASYREALAITRGLTDREPVRGEWWEALWRAYSNVGWLLLERGDLEPAMERFEQGLAVVRSRIESRPADGDWHFNLVSNLAYVGLVRQEQGAYAAALDSFTEALKVAEAFAGSHPADVRWQFEQSLNHGRIAFVLQLSDDLEAAAAAFLRSLAINERLVEQDPSNARWLRELAVSYSGLASIRRRRGELDAARRSMESSLAISRRLAAQDPSNASQSNDLAWDLIQLGMVHAALGRPAVAGASWEEALAIIAPIAEATDSLYYRDTQVLALLNLGRVEEARPIVERLLAGGWDDADFLELAREHGLAP